MTKIIRIGMWQ
ncbi:hypothetical protein LINPERPRIM_LOCUS25197 [Linum perenne]